MNKPTLAALALAVLILLGIPWLFGALAQQRIEADVARLDADSDVAAEVVDYARGWARSTATIELRLPAGGLDPAQLPEDAPAPLAAAAARLAEPVRLAVTMRHGPLLLADGPRAGIMASTIRPDPAMPGYSALLAELGVPYLFEIRSVTGFDGRSDFVAEMPPLALERDDLTLAFSGSRFAGVYEAAARRLEGTGDAASLHVESQGTAFDLERLSFGSDSTRYNDLLRLGFAEASVGRVSATGAGEGFVIDDLAVRFDVDLEQTGEHATMTGAYRLGRFSDGGDVELSDLEIVASARRVDVDALTAYVVAAQEAAVQNDAAAPLSLPVEDALYALLADSPEIELAPVRLQWNGEPLTAAMRFNIDGARLPERTNFTLLVLALEGVVAVDASLEVSEALATMLATRGMAFQVRRNAAQSGVPMPEDEVLATARVQAAIALAGLVAQGMLTSVEGGYTTTAQFARGELTVNGNRVPFGLR